MNELAEYEMKMDVTVTVEQTELIKRTICQGATEQEMQLFFFDCKRRGVHPLDRLIHFTKRSGKYTPITSIDFFRQRAHSSGAYAGEEPPAFELLTSGAPDVCTYTVYRIVQGVRCPWTAKARWDEYYPGDSLGFMWKKMPFLMLAKCAEALALRKAFPAELQGLYVKEEMDQAGPVKVGTVPEEHAAADGLGSVRQASEPMRTATAEDESIVTNETDAEAEARAKAHEHDDPAEPYRAKIKTAHDEKECRVAYDATPETLKQDVHQDYFDKLKELGKRKK